MFDSGILDMNWIDTALHSSKRKQWESLSSDDRGVLNHFVNPRLGLRKVTKIHNLPIKRLKIEQKYSRFQTSTPDHWILPFMEYKYCAKQPRVMGSSNKLMQAII